MFRNCLVSFEELGTLSLGCPKCSTRILFDCKDREARIPSDCPGCGHEYPEAFRSVLHSYREIYRKLSADDQHKVELAIALPVRSEQG